MLLAVCSALPSCPSHSHSLISYHSSTRVFLRRAVEGRHFVEGHSFRLKHGSHAQDMSFTTRATQFMHSLVVESPDQSGSDDSIFAPFPKEFDDIVRGISNEFIDNQAETLSCSSGDRFGLHPLDEYLKCTGSSNISGPSLVTSDMSTTVPENTIETLETVEKINKGSLNLKGSTENFISGVTESLDKSIGRAEDALKSSYDSLVSSFSNTAKIVTESFDSTVSNLVSSVGNSNEQASNQFRGFTNELKNTIYRTEIVATDVLRRAIITVEDSLSNAATFVVYSYGSAKSLLPPDLRSALNLSEVKAMEVLRPFGAAFQQVYFIVEGFERKLGLDPSDPLVQFLFLLGSSATLGVSYWLFMYGGYSGDLTPELALELLKSDENVILIDVRPEDLRDRDGVPDLRRGARSKYAHVIFPELDGSLRKLLKGGQGIDDALIAVVIRNLKVVKDGSKVIVMDATGKHSKAIARSLKKLGVKNPYLVQGGFQLWVRKGLRIKELKPETTLTVLNEEVEAILEDINPTPLRVISFGLGILAAVYALLEWETTLQVIGLIGLGQTLYKRFASYEGSEDFKQDIRLLLAPVRVGAQAVSWAAGKLEPNKIGLPTSPSSTAIQNRVLQAAAKHESQPPDTDADATQGLQSRTSSNENLDLSEAK